MPYWNWQIIKQKLSNALGWTFGKNVQINKWGSFIGIVWLITMKMKKIMKNRSHN